MITSTTPTPSFDTLLPVRLKALAGRALEQALNHALALDPDHAASLHPLEGHRISVHLEQPGLTLGIEVRDGRLRVGPAGDEADLEVRTRRGALGTLIAQALSGESNLPPGTLHLSGDAGLARQLEGLAHTWQPDFEAAFSEHLGEVLGVPLARVFGKAFKHAEHLVRQTGEDAANWLRDDARLVPARSEVEDFLDAVDVLRERAERLEARIIALGRIRHPGLNQ